MNKDLLDYELIKPIRINPGPEVIGENFFGREKELSYMGDLLKNSSSSILIPGPRRWGKSSFVKELILREPEALKFIYLHLHRTQSVKNLYNYFIDVIHLRNPQAFILKSAQKVKNITNIISSLINKVGYEGFELGTGKIEDKESIELMNSMGKIIKHFPEKKIILVLDEISDFLIDIRRNPGKNEAVNFLKWLRTLRQEFNVQMILTGSINLSSTVRKLKAEDLIGDMTLIQLKPIQEDESVLFFRSLLKSKDIQLKNDALDFCLTKIKDGVHYFIQVFADEISKTCEKGEILEDRGKIQLIYNDLLQSQLPAFSNFNTRLSKYFSKVEQKVAGKILANLASSPMDFDDLFALTAELNYDNKQKLYDLLKRLCDEGYLIETGKRFSFISTFLSDYWENHYYFNK